MMILLYLDFGYVACDEIIYCRDFAYVARDRGMRTHMCHVFHCDMPARQIANTLRDICKKIMLERSLHQSAVAKLTRPTDLPNLDKVNPPNGEKLSFQSHYNSELVCTRSINSLECLKYMFIIIINIIMCHTNKCG